MSNNLLTKILIIVVKINYYCWVKKNTRKKKIQKKEGKIKNRQTKRGKFYIKFFAKINYLNLTILLISLKKKISLWFKDVKIKRQNKQSMTRLNY